jgi:hypothetical protein
MLRGCMGYFMIACMAGINGLFRGFYGSLYTVEGVKVSVLAYTVASVYRHFFVLPQETDNLDSCSTCNVS